MALILYDLCGADDLRFSPFCWRTRLALMHKKLDFDTVPVRFTEKDKIAFSGQKLVPVIDDGGHVVNDSWAIAEYLEDTYPDRPALFPGERGRQYAKMTNEWADGINPLIRNAIILDVHHCLDLPDQDYFRATREEKFGQTLEALQASRDDTRRQLNDAMAAMRAHLMDGPFVGGAALDYSDMIVFGSLKWADQCSDYPLLEGNEPVAQWYARVADAMGVG